MKMEYMYDKKIDIGMNRTKAKKVLALMSDTRMNLVADTVENSLKLRFSKYHTKTNRDYYNLAHEYFLEVIDEILNLNIEDTFPKIYNSLVKIKEISSDETINFFPYKMESDYEKGDYITKHFVYQYSKYSIKTKCLVM